MESYYMTLRVISVINRPANSIGKCISAIFYNLNIHNTFDVADI